MGAWYRVRQFTAALRPSPGPSPGPTAALPLNDAGRALFLGLPPAYRDHTLRVYRRLLAAGEDDAELLQASLLHDVGKATARIRLHHRVLGVLLRRLALGLLLWLAREAPPGSWRYPFYVQRHHAQVGARLAVRAGVSPRVLALIAGHHDKPGADQDPALSRLRDADGAE